MPQSTIAALALMAAVLVSGVQQQSIIGARIQRYEGQAESVLLSAAQSRIAEIESAAFDERATGAGYVSEADLTPLLGFGDFIKESGTLNDVDDYHEAEKRYSVEMAGGVPGEAIVKTRVDYVNSAGSPQGSRTFFKRVTATASLSDGISQEQNTAEVEIERVFVCGSDCLGGDGPDWTNYPN